MSIWRFFAQEHDCIILIVVSSGMIFFSSPYQDIKIFIVQVTVTCAQLHTDRHFTCFCVAFRICSSLIAFSPVLLHEDPSSSCFFSTCQRRVFFVSTVPASLSFTVSHQMICSFLHPVYLSCPDADYRPKHCLLQAPSLLFAAECWHWTALIKAFSLSLAVVQQRIRPVGDLSWFGSIALSSWTLLVGWQFAVLCSSVCSSQTWIHFKII